MWAKINFKGSNFNSETLSMIKYVVNHFRNFSGLELNYEKIGEIEGWLIEIVH